MPLIPALGRKRQADLCEFEASLVYRVSFRTVRDTQRNPVLKNKNQKNKKLHTLIFVYMNVLPAMMSIYHMCAWCPKRPEGLTPLEMELQMVLSYHVGYENQLWSFRTVNTLHH